MVSPSFGTVPSGLHRAYGGPGPDAPTLRRIGNAFSYEACAVCHAADGYLALLPRRRLLAAENLVCWNCRYGDCRLVDLLTAGCHGHR